MPADTPPVILTPFGHDADPAYIDLIPETTVENDRASFELGFPPLTMQPIVSGGKPPFGQDVNGILFMLSSHTVYQESGQPYYYSSELATAIGGYAVGTLLGMTDGSGFWINRTAGNTTDPDASGAGWVPVYSYGATTVAGLVGGTVALSADQSKKKMIVLQGVLSGNLILVLPTGVVQEWLIVNQTTGAFSTLVKTSAGTGVTVPQGGYAAPTGVYSEGANIYPSVAPVSLPIDQAPNPLTIVQRTAAGYVTATYFNQSSALENLAAAAIYFDIGDGFHRKIAPVNLAAQMALSWFAGQVSNAQVPYSAVQQYAAALFTSPAFTGVPTAPTAAVGTSSAQVATTAFANPGQSQIQNGYVKLPGGTIMQWGRVTLNDNQLLNVAFPIAFPSACFSVVCSGGNSFGGESDNTAYIATDQAITTASFYIKTQEDEGGNSRVACWFAVGA